MKLPIPEGHNALAYVFAAVLIGLVILFVADSL